MDYFWLYYSIQFKNVKKFKSLVINQCLASWFSCQEFFWIFDISCQDLGNYSWQGSQDFA